ncbi:MAG: GTPase, partial [Candidatus Aerophobetes bacterium]|nr:GTPase [Candidatus Aerophobetes bacterium]
MAHLSAGIIGLPNVGKSTLFNALTRAAAQVATFPFSTISPGTGIASVPDLRLTELSKLINPQKTTPSAIEFVDIAGLVKGAHQGEGLGNEFLSRIRGVDVVVEVVRCFKEKEIAHLEGSVDPVRDIEIIETELLLSDLEMVERRLTKMNKLVKSVSKESKEKLALLQKTKKLLEKGQSLRKVCSNKEKIELAREGFLSSKPLIYVANIGEDDLISPSSSS